MGFQMPLLEAVSLYSEVRSLNKAAARAGCTVAEMRRVLADAASQGLIASPLSAAFKNKGPAQLSEEKIAELYAGQRYDDVKLKPSTYEAKLWPKRVFQDSATGCAAAMCASVAR